MQNTNEKNHWVPLKGYEGVYWINTTGSVRNAKGHVLKPIQTKDGDKVELRINGVRDQIYVDQLIYNTFGG